LRLLGKGKKQYLIILVNGNLVFELLENHRNWSKNGRNSNRIYLIWTAVANYNKNMKNGSNIKKPLIISSLVIMVAVISGGVLWYSNSSDRLFNGNIGPASVPQCDIVYPFNESVFPPELPSPKFLWRDRDWAVDRWIVGVFCGDSQKPFCRAVVTRSPWRLTGQQWENLKNICKGKQVRFRLQGISGHFAPKTKCAGETAFTISSDSVGAPIFYREVNLPFADAVKDPSRIRWRFGAVNAPGGPPVVLENLPVCGNCHSFSANGSVLGMDIDYANDKGSYAVAEVEKNIVLDKKKIITWMDYKKEDGTFTFGLLSRVSPSGKWIISTVKDRSVFLPRPDTAFSQLFFPVKGILVVYTRATGKFASLPGADDPAFVQSNPAWSPDEQTVLFIRAHSYDLHLPENVTLLSEQECSEFTQGKKQFKYDIYGIPFNSGKGGIPRPLAGASNNGMSNFFPVYSPDGKWIVFCKAANFSLLQPDSRLYIMPAGGGEPRLMQCNRSMMNSWHSFSPNGRWMVFSSKEFSPFTQLFLTHIDSSGMDAPPVVLDQFTNSDRAANIPEFVNTSPDKILSIKEHFLDDFSFVRAAQEPLRQKDIPVAINFYKTALGINPDNASAHFNLACALEEQGDQKAAREQYLMAIKADSTMAQAYNNLAITLSAESDMDQMKRLLERAIALQPKYVDSYFNYGVLLQTEKRFEEAARYFSMAIKLEPKWVQAYERLGQVRAAQGKFDQAARAFRSALSLDPKSETAKSGLADCNNKR
jgi:Tfp pilus assembly protein PilF